MRSAIVVTLAVLGVLALAAAEALRAPVPSAPAPPPAASPAALDTYSNILPEDYTGPDKCRSCHEEKFADWERHPHRRMNQDASDATIKGDFSGVQAVYSGGTITFATEAGTRTMTLERGGKLVRKYRVTRTVGSRFMQMYIGLQVEGPEPKDALPYREEHKLSFGWWFKMKRWLPVSFFDPVGAETLADGTPAYDPFDRPRVHVWRSNCMICHNTIPYLYRLALPDLLEGFPHADHNLMIGPLRAEFSKHFDIASGGGVEEKIQPTDLVSMGVSCEACHWGGREHAKGEGEAESRVLPSSPFVRWQSRAPAPAIVSSSTSAEAINGICAQCHNATITRYANGAGTWNSREALDMVEGACSGAIKCTDCHDPHVRGGAEDRPLEAGHVEACIRCHPKMAPDHSHHDAAAGVTCLDCHMPKATQGLEEVVRTHRISSPTDARMLATGGWNACNLCHLDRSLTWTVERLEKDWKKKIPIATTWHAVEKPVGLAWLEGKDPSMRLVASQAFARSPLGKEHLADLVRALDDPVGVNRVFDSFAVERVRGRPLSIAEFDVMAPADVRARQVEHLLSQR